MTLNQFFVRKSACQKDWVDLEGPEHHHLSRVGRTRKGDCVWLFDEEGTRYEARVEEVRDTTTRLRILGRQDAERPAVPIALAQAVLKSRSMDFLVQKATEVGLAVLYPVRAERAVARVEERAEGKVRRWSAIAREAAKQSKSGRVPVLKAPCDLSEVLAQEPTARKILLTERPARPMRDMLQETDVDRPSSVLLCVGPEGGWTWQEEEVMRRAGCEPTNLGRHVLRAETASLAALALLNLRWNW